MEFFDRKTIATILSCVVVASGAVFAGTKYLNEQQVKVLEERLKLAGTKVVDLQKELNVVRVHSSQDSSVGENLTVLPKKVKYEALANPETRKLIEQVEKLEKEKSLLLKQLSQSAVTSLDPNSEVSILLNQLKNNIRPEGSIATLFKIKSPVSFEPLQSYFLKNYDGEQWLLKQLNTAWYEFFFSVDEDAGLKFAVSQLENEKENINSVYSFLSRSIDSKKHCDIVTPELERIAVSNSNSEVRGNAKLLLQCIKREETSDYLYNDDNPGTQHKLLVLFSSSGIEGDFYELVARSNQVYYWSTSVFLYEKYADSNFKDKSYLLALEKLSKKEMSTSSKAFTFYMLGKAYEKVGNVRNAVLSMDNCKKLAPNSCGGFALDSSDGQNTKT